MDLYWKLVLYFGLFPAVAVASFTPETVHTSSGSSLVLLPCHCAHVFSTDKKSRTISWSRVVGENEVTLEMLTNLTKANNAESDNYALIDDLTLQIANPTDSHTGIYVCRASGNNTKPCQSSVQLVVEKVDKEWNTRGLKHYLIPLAIAVFVLIEVIFVYVLWRKLRKKRSPERVIPEYVRELPVEDGLISVPLNPELKTNSLKDPVTLLRIDT